MDTFFFTRNISMSAVLLLLGVFSSMRLQFIGAQPIGVCYGGNGNNLPSKQDVVNLYKSYGIGKMRLYNPDELALQALRGSNIEVIVGVPNADLLSLTNVNNATNWVNKYIIPYSNDVKFKYIAVGNEVQPGDAEASSVLPAMENIQKAISALNLQSQIKVSTPIDTRLIDNFYPDPNKAVFTTPASGHIRPIITFLSNHEAPLLAHIFPYFAYFYGQDNYTLPYALFTQQGENDAGYQNLFDALMDAIHAALEKNGGSNIKIVVSQSGWPSAGGVGASINNAETYYMKLVNHVEGGTPKRPNIPIETYLFAMFDENEKEGAETEKHFGLFNPISKSLKYGIDFQPSHSEEQRIMCVFHS